MTPLERLCLGHGKKPQDWQLLLEKHIPANAVFWIFGQARYREAIDRRENPGTGYLEIDTIEAKEAAVRFMPLVSKALGRPVEIAAHIFGAMHCREVSREKKPEQKKTPVTVTLAPIKLKPKPLSREELEAIHQRRFHQKLLARQTRLKIPRRTPKHVVATNGRGFMSIQKVPMRVILHKLRQWNGMHHVIVENGRDMVMKGAGA